MTNFTQVPPSPTSAKQENLTTDKGNQDSCDCLWYSATDIKLAIIFSFICIVSVSGLVANGSVIWLLGLRMKRNPFTTYILNLAVADSGVLVFVFFSAVLLNLRKRFGEISSFFNLYVVCIVLFRIMFSIGQFLLVIISIDRCVSVLFPIWYRCHRPENLSTILCANIWIFYFLVHGILTTLEISVFVKNDLPLYVFLVNAVVCLPLITISTIILFIKFCFNSQQRRRRKLLTAILLALLFFLFFAFPLNIMYLIYLRLVASYKDFSSVKVYILSAGYLCASINSFVNPLIYFLVGIKRRGLCQENMKIILQRVFKQEEEEVYEEEPQSSIQSQISA